MRKAIETSVWSLEECLYIMFGNDEKKEREWSAYIDERASEVEKSIAFDRCGCSDYHCPCDTYSGDTHEMAYDEVEEETKGFRLVTEYDNGDLSVSEEFVDYVNDVMGWNSAD